VQFLAGGEVQDVDPLFVIHLGQPGAVQGDRQGPGGREAAQLLASLPIPDAHRAVGAGRDQRFRFRSEDDAIDVVAVPPAQGAQPGQDVRRHRVAVQVGARRRRRFETLLLRDRRLGFLCCRAGVEQDPGAGAGQADRQQDRREDFQRTQAHGLQCSFGEDEGLRGDDRRSRGRRVRHCRPDGFLDQPRRHRR
jgi:hypothetical protein